MTEAEYIRVRNLGAVKVALNAMSDVMAGDEWGVTESERVEITKRLAALQDKLFDVCVTTED